MHWGIYAYQAALHYRMMLADILQKFLYKILAGG
jgi:hypothetical protein